MIEHVKIFCKTSSGYCLDRIGLNVPFSVFTWANYTPICDMDLQYPWNLVKGGLKFTRNGEKLVLPGPMTAQYIILMMDRRNPGTRVKTLVMSEIEAFGRKIRDAYVPPTPRFGVRTRNTVSATLAGKLKMGAQSWDYFKTNLIFNPDKPEDVTTTEVQMAIKQIIDNYGEYFAHNAPCDWKPYIIANSTLTAMLNYNNVILSQRDENITRLPAFSRIMGDVHPKANPNSYSVTLKVTAKSNFFPVGAYAKAGFVIDEQPYYGWGHSGWPGEPMMGNKQFGRFFQDMNMIKSGESIGITHEIGHNLQPNMVTFINGVEVTSNIFIPLVHSFLLNISAYEFGVTPGLGEEDMKQLVKDWNGNRYTGVQLAYYNILGHYFSHGLVGNALTTVFADGVQLTNEQEKVNYWVKLISLEAGYDLVPFHRLWHFPIDQKTKKATQHLPCFFPDNQLTKQVPTQVNRILRQHGKPCSRRRPNVVQFKGDLMHGVNRVDKRFIFIRG
ncbi:hypothetical protein EG68_09892 [Paragonimus skrjabini miyazakii]|uniref:Peptidase M60 domain-containing protein n=1 Tax=Paragonimus skrjabini miyazakii TaxID=59628 RepID=A0A8S9YGD7_9TREM|nr:hypothetical protein EG68_09892 [Paragonimus skrjabini miyazakii]